VSSRSASEDPYIDPATGLLRNLLDITDRLTLEQVETDLSFAAAIVLAEHPLPGAYNLAHLQGFHRALFGDVYAWAGELRTVQIAKTEPFCLPQHIESSASEVFGAIRSDDYAAST
jgi:cell filamentation protein